MAVKSERISLSTKGNADMLDITDQVSRVVVDSGLNDGVVTLFTPSSTSGLTTIEYESGCIKDLRRLFDEIIDPGRHYDHNARWGDGNGHSHVRAALLGASFSVPFTNRKLNLGTWQQIIFVDFDNRSRRRELVLQLIGE
jgi:secondary thiamine-phosphate synthase enzyme